MADEHENRAQMERNARVAARLAAQEPVKKKAAAKKPSSKKKG